MAENNNMSSQFAKDVSNYIQKKVLAISQRNLVFFQFGEKLEMPKQMGINFTATRFERIPLPSVPLTEGVPANGETLTISQVTGVCQQWGDRVNVTDVADMTITHPVFRQAINAVALQIAETNDRNVVNTLMTGTNIYYAGGGSTRASVASNLVTTTALSYVLSKMRRYGAPSYSGPDAQPVGEGADIKVDPRILRKPGPNRPHYIGIIDPGIEQDLVNASVITQAFQYSAIEALYDGEVGQWSGVRFCRSNLIPRLTSGTAPTLTAGTTGGSLATGTYYVVVTGVDTQNYYESVIYQEASVAVTGPTGDITFTTPDVPGYVYNVYVGTTSGGEKLALSGLDYNTAATITANGTGAAVPPALGSATDTVVPSFIFGQGAYGIAPLDRTQTFMLDKADKADPQNQLRVVSWKTFYASLILNQNFMIRLESSTDN